MPGIKEAWSGARTAWSSAKERVHPEGIIIGGAVGVATPLIASPLAEGLTSAVQEFKGQLDQDLLRAITVGAIATVGAFSVARESRTLDEQGYSASSSTNVLNVATGKRKTSSVIGHAAGSVELLGINTLAEVVFFGGNKPVLTEGLPTAILVTAGLRAGMNTLILQGRAEPLVKVIKVVEDPVVKVARLAVERSIRTVGVAKETIIRKLKKGEEIIIDTTLDDAS